MVKAKVSPCLNRYQRHEDLRGENCGKFSCILNLGTRWIVVVSITFRPISPHLPPIYHFTDSLKRSVVEKSKFRNKIYYCICYKGKR
jgi:hypothetical protein